MTKEETELAQARIIITNLQQQNTELLEDIAALRQELGTYRNVGRKSYDGKTEDEVLEEVCRRRGGVSPAIQEVYEKYKHLDHLLSDPQWTEDTLLGQLRLDLWQAIKAHAEERQP